MTVVEQAKKVWMCLKKPLEFSFRNIRLVHKIFEFCDLVARVWPKTGRGIIDNGAARKQDLNTRSMGVLFWYDCRPYRECVALKNKA